MACLWRSQIPKSYLLFILRVVVENYYCCSNFPFQISNALPYHFDISIGTAPGGVAKAPMAEAELALRKPKGSVGAQLALRKPKGSVGEHQTIKSERRPARSLVLPKDFKCKVSKEFIDEMATLADSITPIVPKRLRKLEEAYERNELQKMRRMHYESAVVENTNAGVSGAEGTLSTGQNVHHWWAKWFKTAKKQRDQIAKKDRPKWYDATILAAMGKRRVWYMGRWFDEPTYQVH